MPAKPENAKREASRKQVNLNTKVDPEVRRAFDYWRNRTGLSANKLIKLLFEMTAPELANKFPVD